MHFSKTYLHLDVRDLTKVGDEKTFFRFIRAAAARSGHLLDPYHTNITKRLTRTPKLYFLDTGLCSWLTEWSSPETLEACLITWDVHQSPPLVYAHVSQAAFAAIRGIGKTTEVFSCAPNRKKFTIQGPTPVSPSLWVLIYGLRNAQYQSGAFDTSANITHKVKGREQERGIVVLNVPVLICEQCEDELVEIAVSRNAEAILSYKL